MGTLSAEEMQELLQSKFVPVYWGIFSRIASDGEAQTVQAIAEICVEKRAWAVIYDYDGCRVGEVSPAGGLIIEK